MQKVITVSLDTKSLMHTENGKSVVTEITEVNNLLEMGWELEEYEILHKDEASGKVLLWLVLTDDLFLPADEDDDDEDEDFDIDDF